MAEPTDPRTHPRGFRAKCSATTSATSGVRETPGALTARLDCEGCAPRPSPIDTYLPLIRETLEKFPTLTASRLLTKAYERGYRGRADHFRHLVAEHRPRRPDEAYLHLRSLPGEQAQVDWGHFGTLQIGRAR